MSTFYPPSQITSIFDSYFYDYPYQQFNIGALNNYLLLSGGTCTGLVNFSAGLTAANTITSTSNISFTGTSNTLLFNGSIAGTIQMNSSTATTINMAGTNGGIYLTGSASVISVANTSATSISTSGGISATGNIDASSFSLSGAALSLSAIAGVTAGTATASKALILDANSRINFNVNSTYSSAQALTWYGGTANQLKCYMYRASDSTGLIIGYQNVSASTNRTSSLLRLKCSLDPSTQVAGLSAYNYTSLFTVDFADKSGGWAAWNFGIGALQGSTYSFASGYPSIQSLTTTCTALNICSGSNTVDTATNNILITGSNQYCFNTITPNGTYMLTLNGTAANNGVYINGNATVLYLDNTTGTTTDRLSMVMNHSTQWEWSLGGSAHSTVPNGLYWYNGGYKMVLNSSGWLGLGGVTSPVCQLDVGGSASVTTTTNIAINTYYITVSTGAVTNMGGGPVTVTICARFRSNIWVQDKIVATSDRRLKTDINTLDFELEHFKKLRPVSYRMKNETQIKLGLIAQELNSVCGEAISYMPNENMKVEEEEDPDGMQMGVDYTSIIMMNTVAIKKLINQIEILNNKIELLEEKLATP